MAIKNLPFAVLGYSWYFLFPTILMAILCYWVSSTLPTDKPRHFLNFRVFRWIHPFEFPLIFTSKQRVSPSVYRISTLTSFPPFDPEIYWVPNPLRKHLLALIALSHQFNTALSVLASSPLSPPLLSPSFLLHSFPALVVACVIYSARGDSFLFSFSFLCRSLCWHGGQRHRKSPTSP